MHLAWIAVLVLWIFEVVTSVFFLFLPVVGVWETNPSASSLNAVRGLITTITVLYIAATAWTIYTRPRSRDQYTWHFAMGAWVWGMLTIAVWWWGAHFSQASINNFAAPGYASWKSILALGVVAAWVMMHSAINTIRFQQFSRRARVTT